MAQVASWQYVRVKIHGVAGKIAFLVLMLSQILGPPNSEAHAVEVSFADFPFLIACEAGGIYQAYYLSRIGKDGVAVYATHSGQAGTLSLTGKAKQVGADIQSTQSTCAGKTLEELRSAGQTYYLKR